MSAPDEISRLYRRTGREHRFAGKRDFRLAPPPSAARPPAGARPVSLDAHMNCACAFAAGGEFVL
jgi:hypothetical protein